MALCFVVSSWEGILCVLVKEGYSIGNIVAVVLDLLRSVGKKPVQKVPPSCVGDGNQVSVFVYKGIDANESVSGVWREL